MDETAVREFIGYYERITRNMLADLPTTADLVIVLNESHGIGDVRWRR